jgi:hypothetical protein
MTRSEQPLQYMAYNPQHQTEVKGNFFNLSKKNKGEGVHWNNRQNNQTQGREALRDGTRRDRARVFDCPDSEQYYIEIEVWSSLYSNEKSMIDGENDTRIACDKSIEP